MKQKNKLSLINTIGIILFWSAIIDVAFFLLFSVLIVFIPQLLRLTWELPSWVREVYMYSFSVSLFTLFVLFLIGIGEYHKEMKEIMSDHKFKKD
jgi:hypothetical protein